MTRFLHSSSAQKYYENCPAQFELYQTGAEKGPTPEHFKFGQAAHLVMQSYVDHCIASKRRTDITVIGDFVDAAVRQVDLPLSRYDELAQVVRGFLAVYEIDVEHSLEREGGIAFGNDLDLISWRDDMDYDRMRRPMDHAARGVMIRARLDHTLLFLDERRLVVQDYKTDLFMPSPSSIADPSSRFNAQARKYAVFASRAYFPADVVEVEFPFMRRTAYGKYAKRTLMFTREQILEIEELELAKIRYIESTTSFPARPGDHCASCQYRETSCPIPTELVTDDPEATARRYVYERVLQESRLSTIKEHVAEHGWDGEVGALRAQFVQGEAQVPDMRKVWEELLDVGYPEPWRVMNFSKSDAAELLDKDVLQRVLERAYSPEITIRFNVHQPKPALEALAREHGIDLTKPGKTKRIAKTAAELAWDLAQVGSAAPSFVTREGDDIPHASTAWTDKPPSDAAYAMRQSAPVSAPVLVDLSTITGLEALEEVS